MLRLTWLALALLALPSSGCTSQAAAPRWPLRALSSEAPQLEQPELQAPILETAAVAPDAAQPEAPRIGAPGGSGAGSRRVATARN